jgi:hypothetical protein
MVDEEQHGDVVENPPRAPYQVNMPIGYGVESSGENAFLHGNLLKIILRKMALFLQKALTFLG